MKTKKPLVMKYAFDDGEPGFVPLAKLIADNLYQLALVSVQKGDRSKLRAYCEEVAQFKYEQMAEEYTRELAKQAKARKAEDANKRLRKWFDRTYRQQIGKRSRVGAGLLLVKTQDMVKNNIKDGDPEQKELLDLLNDYRARIYLKNRQN